MNDASRIALSCPPFAALGSRSPGVALIRAELRSIMKTLFRFVITVLATLTAGTSAAWAVTFQQGDVFAAIGSGRVQHYNSSLTLLETLNTGRGGWTTGMAFDSAGNLYVTNFSDGSISKFDNSGTLVNATFVSGINMAPESIVFDAAGNFYVGTADGNRDILKFSSTGSLLANYNVAVEDRGADWIDLASDGKTMFYTSEGYKVKRFDVSTNTQLADFATLNARPAFALRLLDDGGLLVADAVNIARLNAAGATVQLYDVAVHNSWFALNLDPDNTSFWSGDSSTGQFHKFDIATGAHLASKNTGAGANALFGLTVYGEKTQAVPTPDAGATLLYVLLAIPGFVALHFRRRKAA